MWIYDRGVLEAKSLKTRKVFVPQRSILVVATIIDLFSVKIQRQTPTHIADTLTQLQLNLEKSAFSAAQLKFFCL